MMVDRYKGRQWSLLRNRILKRDLYKCVQCIRYGKTTSAQTVHHVIPVEQRPDLYFKSCNLISLCDVCHNKMHNRDGHELTEEGKRWVRRIWGKES